MIQQISGCCKSQNVETDVKIITKLTFMNSERDDQQKETNFIFLIKVAFVLLVTAACLTRTKRACFSRVSDRS